MKLEMKVRRGWDSACEKAMEHICCAGEFSGKSFMVSSVEMTLSHILIIELVPHHGWYETDRALLKYWWRSMLRQHR